MRKNIGPVEGGFEKFFEVRGGGAKFFWDFSKYPPLPPSRYFLTTPLLAYKGIMFKSVSYLVEQERTVDR